MAGPQIPKDFRTVIVAASVGNVIEWYDFYIFGSLAAVLSVKFFEQSHPVAALLSTIALFTAGFLIRPLGAFLFGWMGDRVGRKYTFLVTLSGMGLGTGAIGLIPTYQSIGLTAAFVLFGLRMIQGLCLGGEYGGAITYVAEHVPDESRGYYTGWLQTSPTLGIVVSLAVRHDRPQAGDLGWHVARRSHVLSAVSVAGNGYAAGQHQLSDRGLHHLHPRLLRRDGLWAGRGVPGGVLPRQDSLHVGIGAVSHRQRLGWRIGAVHHLGVFRGHRQHWLRADLSNCGSPAGLRARPS